MVVVGGGYLCPQFVKTLAACTVFKGAENTETVQVGSLMNENLDLVTCLDWSSKQQNLLSVQRSSSVQQEVLAVEQVRKGVEKRPKETEHLIKH